MVDHNEVLLSSQVNTWSFEDWKFLRLAFG
jgi:hypothetical protein